MLKKYYWLLFLGLPMLLTAQKKEKAKWDVANPSGNWKDISFTTDEGTWMNLDISPNGSTIVFDLLGDIYTMPITGGTAKVISDGIPYEIQPRFSPDGKKILFTSDRGGGDNIWVMDANGENRKQITKESFRLLNNGVWLPGGDYIVARKHFTSSRSLGAGEMWMYHITGGTGTQLTKRKNDQQDVNEPTVSSDGRYIYYSEDMYGGGFFQYNKDPNKQIYAIRRYDRETGEIQTITGGPGGASRPEISGDGKHLAFIKRVREKSILYIHDLETGAERPVFDKLSKDQTEAWAIFGTYTGFDWLPNNQELLIWGQGKIWRLNVKTGQSTEIPFKANVAMKVNETVRFKNKVHQDKFDVKVIRQAKTSPDGRTLIFNAVGQLWSKSLPNGRPKRLTKASNLEFEPAFSPDGKTIAYVTWNDEKMGELRKLDLRTKRSVKINTSKGIFRTPCFSPDGKMIVFSKEGGNDQQGFVNTKKPGVYTVSTNGGTEKFIAKSGYQPSFSADGKRIIFQTGGTYIFGSLKRSLKSVNRNGKDEKTLVNTKYGNTFALSPDNKWIAFSELYKVYIAPMPKTGKAIGLTSKSKSVPVAQVAKDAGINLHWSADSKKLHWTLGDEYFTDELLERFMFLEGARDSVPPIDTVGVKIGLTLESDQPEGDIVLEGATILTMEGEEVIENGVLWIKGNKIHKLGKKGDFEIPANAYKMDATGKTIMPGLVDVHAHVGNFRYGLSPQKQWHYFANLAYGVTTCHDPSSNSEMIFSQSEMIKAGKMVGPRMYSTGTILYGADGDFKAVVNNVDDARSAIRRTKAYGAFSVKSYNQPRREQRQQVMQAAKELGIIVVPEGGSTFSHNLTQIIDGHTGVEHNLPVAPLQNDVIQLWKNTKAHNTPTLIVNYGGLNGEYYFYQKTKVWENEKLLKYTPRAVIDSRSRHRMMVPDAEYENGHILVSKSLKKLQDNGVNINLGSHGQLQGLGAHWELWMFEQGGMSNMQVLRAGTINGAEYIGMSDEIGSLKEGKLADLLILDKNPMDNIRNTESVRYTMLNGRLYDTETMDEIGNTNVKRGKFYWELPENSDNFPWHYETNSVMPSQCSCRQ